MADFRGVDQEQYAPNPWKPDPSPIEEVARENSLEEELGLLEQQLYQLTVMTEQIRQTKQRIEDKNTNLGNKIAKLYEMNALISRGEYAESDTKAAW